MELQKHEIKRREGSVPSSLDAGSHSEDNPSHLWRAFNKKHIMKNIKSSHIWFMGTGAVCETNRPCSGGFNIKKNGNVILAGIFSHYDNDGVLSGLENMIYRLDG